MKNKQFNRCRNCGTMYEVEKEHKCLTWAD